MKIRPKPRKYNNEDIDESYFATKSDENSRSRDGDGDEDDEGKDKLDFFKTSKREFKIFDKKICEKGYSSNRIRTFKYSRWNFIPLNLVDQLNKPLNMYFILIMLLQMIAE